MFKPHSLARINIFLETSIPQRSILGSGSVNPKSTAFETISWKVSGFIKLLKISNFQ